MGTHVRTLRVLTTLGVLTQPSMGSPHLAQCPGVPFQLTPGLSVPALLTPQQYWFSAPSLTLPPTQTFILCCGYLASRVDSLDVSYSCTSSLVSFCSWLDTSAGLYPHNTKSCQWTLLQWHPAAVPQHCGSVPRGWGLSPSPLACPDSTQAAKREKQKTWSWLGMYRCIMEIVHQWIRFRNWNMSFEESRVFRQKLCQRDFNGAIYMYRHTGIFMAQCSCT